MSKEGDQNEGGELSGSDFAQHAADGEKPKNLLVVSAEDDDGHLSDYQHCARSPSPDLPVRGLLFNK